MVTSALLAIVIVAVGVGLTTWAAVPLRLEERLFCGVVVGVLAVSAVSFFAFELFGMGWLTLCLGVGLPGLAAAAGTHQHHGRIAAEARSAVRRLRLPSQKRASMRPFAALTVVGAAVTTRVLALAYQTTPNGISAGSLAVWGDWSVHLAYAASFAYGDNRELRLPTAAGEPMRYHFLVDFFGSLFTVSGATLPQALVLSSWLLAVAFAPLLFSFTLRVAGSRLTAGLAVLLYTLTGGVGAWYFLVEDVRSGGWEILSALPRTYARMPEQALWVDNAVSMSLYAQRSTLLGLVAGFSAGVLILAARPRWARSGFLVAGVLVGSTGIALAHLLATALALGALAALFDRRREWLWFLVPAALIGLPLVWAIRPPRNGMRWLVGWIAPLNDQAWLWFWLRNVGLLLPLFAAVAVFGGVPRRLRRLSAPLWLWFIVPNVIAFHLTEWNNTRFFLFWQVAACIVVGALLSGMWRRAVTRAWHRIALDLAVILAVFALTVSGGLDALRSVQRSAAIPWVGTGDLAAAEWLRDNADAGDRIVYGAHNTSAVAAVSGVAALSGYPGWTYDLVNDWSERLEASRSILAGDNRATDQVERYGIDFVVIGPRERSEYGASDDYWEEHATLAFEDGDYRIYRVAS
jgi:hypothetical protein